MAKDINQRLIQISNTLSDIYTKKQLSASLVPYVKLLIKKNDALLLEKGIGKTVLKLSVQKSLSKDQQALLASIPFLDKEIFLLFKRLYTPDLQAVFDELLWRDIMHQDEILQELNVEVSLLKEHKNSYHTYAEKKLKSEFYFFQVVDERGWSYQSNSSFSLFIHAALKEIILPFIELPKEAALAPVDRTRPGLIEYNNGDQFILSELGRVALYLDQGLLKRTVAGHPILSSISSMQKKLKLTEFFPDEKNKWLKNLRSNLLVSVIHKMANKIPPSDPITQMKLIFPKHYTTMGESFYAIFSFIKGYNRIEKYYLNKEAEASQWTLLERLAVGTWYDINNIIDHMKYHLLIPKVVRAYEAARYLYHEYEEESDYGYSYKQKFYIRKNKYHKAIEIPFIKGSFFLFAAMGLLDIAYKKPDVETMGKTCDSPYDGLAYIRLSALGAFLLGKTDSYTPPVALQTQTIKLSSSALLIIADGNADHNAILLEPYAEKIDEKHYKVTYEQFFAGCQSKRELKAKIERFKSNFSAEIPANWHSFFEELERKMNPLDEPESLYVFKINPSNTELIQLLARDPILKTKVMKAENYHVLIPKDQWASFKKRLRSFGYLLTR